MNFLVLHGLCLTSSSISSTNTLLWIVKCSYWANGLWEWSQSHRYGFLRTTWSIRHLGSWPNVMSGNNDPAKIDISDENSIGSKSVVISSWKRSVQTKRWPHKSRFGRRGSPWMIGSWWRCNKAKAWRTEWREGFLLFKTMSRLQVDSPTVCIINPQY